MTTGDWDSSMSEAERAKAEALLAGLHERDRQILTLRYALDGHPQPRSLTEVAGLLGCSEEAVRQDEAAAMAALRARMRGDA